MFNFLTFLMSLLHSIPFKRTIHFLACKCKHTSQILILAVCYYPVLWHMPCVFSSPTSSPPPPTSSSSSPSSSDPLLLVYKRQTEMWRGSTKSQYSVSLSLLMCAFCLPLPIEGTSAVSTYIFLVIYGTFQILHYKVGGIYKLCLCTQRTWELLL